MNTGRRYTQQEITDIRARARRGETQMEIAAAYGVTRAAIGLLMTRRGIATVRARAMRRWTAQEIADVVARYEGGCPVRELAADYGITKMGIYSILARGGAVMRPPGRTPYLSSAAHVEQIRSLAASGWSQHRIAEAIGGSPSGVSAVMRRYDITPAGTQGGAR